MSGLLPILTQLDNLAEEVANPNPNRPFQNAVGNFARQVCDRLAVGANDTGITPQTFGLAGGICGPYWDAQGTDAPTVEPTNITGGQCPGISYQVQLVGTGGSGQPINVNQGNFLGPISFAGPAGTPPTCAPNRVLTNERYVSGTGATVFAINQCAEFPVIVQLICTPLSAEPPGGCGEAPPRITPGPNTPADPGPLPPGTGFGVDIRGNPILILPPTLEVAPNINLDVTPELTASFGDGSSGGPPAAPAAAADQIGAGSGGGGGENDFGEPPPGERWVGCCIQITDRPVGSGEIPQSIPQDVYPTTIGNVHLRFANSDGDQAFDTPVTDRSKNVCVWEPLRGLNPTGVFVNLLPGYSYVYTAYSVPLEQ